LQVGGKPTQQVWFREVPLWEQQPQPWWEDVPGLMSLYPLCKHGRRPRNAIVHAAGVIEARASDILERADLLAYLGTFGQLAYPRLNVEAIIGSEKMKESPFLRKILKEGQHEGRIEGERAAILLLLRERFGDKAARTVAAQLEGTHDLGRLEELLKRVVHSATIDEFRGAMQPQP
jgi:hypothetical protein